MATGDIMLTMALAYADRGWRVFPLRRGTKKPFGEIYPDDAPDEAERKRRSGNVWPDVRPRGQGGVHRATTDAALVRDWWWRWPGSDIGLATGPDSGVWVLDADLDAAKGKDGFATLADYAAQGLGLPPTVQQITPSGGRHWLFRWPSGQEVANSSEKRLGNGLDVRGLGGYIVLPPSRHPTGKCYAWDPGAGLDQVAIADAPAWLLAKLAPDAEEAAETRAAAPRAYDPGLLTPYARRALDEECARVAAAMPGNQNTTLNEAAFSLGTLVGAGAIPEGYAHQHLLVAATAMAAHYDPKRGRWKPDQLERVVRDGIRAGAAHPRTLPEPRSRQPDRRDGPRPPHRQEVDQRPRQASGAVQIWARGVPLSSPACPNAVRVYVEAMGLAPDQAPPTLRGAWLDYWHKDDAGKTQVIGCHPCLIAAGGGGRVEGVALTYLNGDGTGRAVVIDPVTGEILPARRPVGIARGVSIRLAALSGERLIIAAPLDAGLMALAAGSQPVWAVGTLEAAASVMVPTGMDITLALWRLTRPRMGRDGLIAQAVAHLHRTSRREVRVALLDPPKGWRP